MPQNDDGATLADLRRAAYSRGASAEAIEQLARFEQRLAEDSATAAVSLPPVDERHEGLPEPEEQPAVAQPNAIDGRARRIRPVRLIVAALTVLVVAAIGFSLGRATPTVGSAGSTPFPSLGLPSAGQHGSATLALLETSQKPSDIPPFALGSDIIASTVHALSAGGSPGVTVYGALSGTRLICLVAVTEDLRSADTCVTEHQFVTEGIRLRITTNDLVKDDAGFSNFAFYEYFWSSDGSISGSSNEYLFPASPHV
jgi:hypothetical protein